MMIYDVNKAIAASDGAGVFYALKVFLLANGWTCPRSGNGAVGGAGDNIAAVADLTNANSWMVLRRPDDGAEFLLSMGGTAATYRWDILYSKGALFIGGAAAVRATATDQKFLLTDAVDFTLTGAATWHFVCDDASPYGFVAFGWQGADMAGMLLYDPMMTTTFNPMDPDPYITGIAVAYDAWRLTEEGDGDGSPRSKGWTAATWGAIPGSAIASDAGNTAFPNGCDPNPYSGTNDDPVIPIMFARNTSQAGSSAWKGLSTFARWVGPNRAAKSTLTEGTTSRIIWGRSNTICLPWPNGVVPA